VSGRRANLRCGGSNASSGYTVEADTAVEQGWLDTTTEAQQKKLTVQSCCHDKDLFCVFFAQDGSTVNVESCPLPFRTLSLIPQNAQKKL